MNMPYSGAFIEIEAGGCSRVQKAARFASGRNLRPRVFRVFFIGGGGGGEKVP